MSLKEKVINGLNPLKRWEIALYIGLFAAILSGLAGARAAEPPLSEKLIRLHVVAASDGAEDQALKLRVRDETLAYLEEPLAAVPDVGEAAVLIDSLLPALEEHLQAYVAGEGFSGDVTVSLGESAFPTKHYDSFSLPAGPYTALRVVLGGGEGQNWWCVVFPPLCTASALKDLTGTEALGLSEEDVALITMENRDYVIKFKLLEWWGQLRNLIG